MKRFFGREAEIALLKRLFDKTSSSFVVVRGRRRIGKSTLIKKFAEPYTFYSFEGIVPTPTTTGQSQRDVFARQLSQQTGLPEVFADDWMKLFQLLWEKAKTGRCVILFDEISWMGSKDADFLGKIKMAWDSFFSQNSQLILIICGSASSWIEKNILSSTGFLGRISYTLNVEELAIQDIKKFWDNKNISNYEILKVASIVGGIPKYLEEINQKLTAEENIKQLCFSPGGFLVDEFNRIFSDLFLRDSETYKKIVEFISTGSKTMTEIAQGVSFSKSGRLSEYLNELELSGFICRDHSWNIKEGIETRVFSFRLKDNYLRFYLKYIAPNMAKIKKGDYVFKSLMALSNWNTILGLQFENLVILNRNLIHKQLHLQPNDILFENPYMQRKGKNKEGCQIDYLIQERFNTLYLCEVKFSINPIGVDVIPEIQKKIERLKSAKNFSFRPVLIHVGGVTSELENNPYFFKMLNFAELF
jgi:AAA+ ATPase superfamily predicted ATPase